MSCWDERSEYINVYFTNNALTTIEVVTYNIDTKYIVGCVSLLTLILMGDGVSSINHS